MNLNRWVLPAIKKMNCNINPFTSKGGTLKLQHTLGLLLLIIASLNGCSKPQNSNPNANGSANSSSSPQAVSATDAANFSRAFEGTLNNQYAIEMNLQRNGESLSGTYLYTRHKVDIPINGTIDGQGNFVINEFDSKGNQTGVFKGRLLSSDSIDGTWSKPNGDKSMPFSLKARGDSSGVASANGANTSSSPPTAVQPASAVTSTNELSRDTVLSLMRGRYSNKVKVSMSTSSYTLRNLTDLYTQMIKAKIISCQSGNAQWNNCTPAANGRSLYMSEQPGGSVAGSLSLDIGNKVPSTVNGISRIDDASAFADVIFVFESNSTYALYTQWSTAFYRPPNTQSEQHRFLLRRYDDGWRIERSLN